MFKIFDIKFTKLRHRQLLYISNRFHISRTKFINLDFNLTTFQSLFFLYLIVFFMIPCQKIINIKRYQMSKKKSMHSEVLVAEQQHLPINKILKPYKDREMTDKPFLWIYSIFSLFVITAFFYTFIRGKDDNLFKPRDPNFRRCGQPDSNARDYKYIYFPAPFYDSINKSVCVKRCPSSSDSTIDCLPNRFVSECTFNMTDHFNRSNQFIIYPTRKNKALSMCQPASRILFDSINQKINTHYLFLNFEKLYQSIPIILLAAPLITLFIVFVFMVFILKVQPYVETHQKIKFVRKKSKEAPHNIEDDSELDQQKQKEEKKISKGMYFLFYGIPIIFGLILIAFTIYSWLPAGKRVFVYMPYIGIAVLVILVLLVSYFFYYKKYFDDSIGLLSLGIIYIKQNPCLIFISVFTFLLFMIVFFLQTLTLLFLYAIDSNPPAENSTQPYTFAYFTAIGNSVYVKILLMFSAFHFIWTAFIIHDIVNYLAMSSSAFWICNVKHNFKNGLYSLLRYHIGSVVKGALFNNFITGYLVKISYLCLPGKNNVCCRCCKCPALKQCYRGDCFSKYFGIFNDLNYVRVSTFGEEYIEAGRKLTHTLVQYLNEVSRIHRVARMLLFISKVLVAFTTTLICYIIIELSSTMRGYFLSNIIIFLISVILTDLAFASYDRSYEVILLTILLKKDESEGYQQASKDGEVKNVLRLYNVQKQQDEIKKVKMIQENNVRIWFYRLIKGKEASELNES